ncbi:MAG: DUF748 domain-containing protein [Halioglobus sp.]
MFGVITRIYLAYLALSVFLILPMLNLLVPVYFERQFERQLSYELLVFNPFTLGLEGRELTLHERDGSNFAGFSNAKINLSLASLWTQGWVFDDIDIIGFFADVHHYGEGEFNFSDLLGSSAATPVEESTDSEVFGLTIEHLHFQANRFSFTDESRTDPFATAVDGVEFTVTDLSTVESGGKPYQFVARGEAGGQLRWQGQVSVPDAYSEGSLSLTDIDLGPVDRFIRPWVDFSVAQGTIGIQGNYRIDWGQELKYSVSEAEVNVSALELNALDTQALPDTSVALASLSATGIDIDSVSEQITIPSLTLRGLAIRGWSEGDRVSLVELTTPKNLPPSEEEPTSSNWKLSIENAALTESSLDWHTEYTDPGLLQITPLELTLNNIQWPPVGELTAELELEVNSQAAVAVNGNLNLAKGAGELSFQLDDLPVSWLNPNLPKTVDASINKGKAKVSGQLWLQDFTPVMAQLDGDIRDFAITVSEDETTATSWKTVRWEELSIDLQNSAISLQSLFIDRYSGRLHIRKDGTINSQRALVEDTEQDEGTDSSLQPTWSFELPSITIADSALDFMDESLPITFRTVIGGMNGDILNISSTAGTSATVDIDGSVDSYAPVKLAGSVNPFGASPELDLGLSFNGVDLARLTPYSGTYAGYAIERGLLNLDLHYSLDGSHLEGDNQVIINQLKLGEKVESDQAVDLPIALAISLLTDSQGVIDLSLPVSGDINDPEFEIGSVIFSVLVNLVTKAVTAPFTLLASLVDSEEDLQRITFASGSSTMDEVAQTKLSQLNEALLQRPQLVIVVHGRTHPTADLDSLRLVALNQQLIAAGLPIADIENREQSWMTAIEKRYQSLPADGEASEAEAPPFKKMHQSVIASVAVDDALLKSLAEERALAVKRYMVNELQLPSDRAVIEIFDIDDEANLFSGTELEIEN